MHRTTTLGIITCLWLGLSLTVLQAAQPVPRGLEDASLERQLQTMNDAGERSLKEQIAVGKERYENRVRYRQQLISVMRTQAATSRQADSVPSASPPSKDRTDEQNASYSGWVFLIIAALTAAGGSVMRRKQNCPA